MNVKRQDSIIKALLFITSLFWLTNSSGSESAEIVNNSPLLEKSENQTIQSSLNHLSTVQTSIGAYVQSFGERLDSLFGSDDYSVHHKGSRLTVYAPLTIDSDGNTLSSLNFRAQMDLPRTNNRWKIILSSFDANEEETFNRNSLSSLQQNPTQDSVNSPNENRLAGRYLLTASENVLRHIDVGLKFIDYIEPNPYLTLKNRHKHLLSQNFESRTTYIAYLDRDKGFAWESEQVFDFRLTHKNLIRSQTTGTWWRDDAEILLNQRFAYYDTPSQYEAKAYFIDGNWQLTNENLDMSSVALGLNWRRGLYKDWLYGEVEPRATWLGGREMHDPLYSIKLMLEMHFYAI